MSRVLEKYGVSDNYACANCVNANWETFSERDYTGRNDKSIQQYASLSCTAENNGNPVKLVFTCWCRMHCSYIVDQRWDCDAQILGEEEAEAYWKLEEDVESEESDKPMIQDFLRSNTLL